jgi:anaerobic magnesium-protoporphyrin IX monomethyl ester cyclase
LGAAAITYFVCGLAKDTRESVAATLAYLSRMPTEIGISLFYPVPGLAEFAYPEFLKGKPPGACAGTSAFPWNNSLSTRELITAFRLSRFANLVKRRPVHSLEANLVARTQQTRRLQTIIKEKGDKNIVEVPGQDTGLVEEYFSRIT